MTHNMEKNLSMKAVAEMIEMKVAIINIFCIFKKVEENINIMEREMEDAETVSYTHLTLPTTRLRCRSRWSPYH